ncbi:MAG TPA: SMI1/KNR4 family protein [Terracidiphilus sp.]|nr:SMI1/KNR4 family protein [Terracidiphilus sp.]
MFEQDDLEAAGRLFAIVGPPVSETDIHTVFTGQFPGKEDLVQFYLHYNGGSRTPQGCVISCRNPAHKVARHAMEKMNVEGFMSVSLDLEDRMLPFRPILVHYATMRQIYEEVPEMKEFLQQNIPFAFDHTGNDLCIDLNSGCVRFLDWTEYGKGAIEISSSFREFVLKYWVSAEFSCGQHS